MAGTFTHLLVAEKAINTFMNMDAEKEHMIIVAKNQKYITLGSNAPDFPYVAKQPKWADRMHYEKSSKIVKKAIRLLKRLEETNHSSFEKCFSWFLGFLSHMTTDVSIHPIVNKIAGPYRASIENQRKHQLCETHMDCYIFKEMANELSLKEAEYINDKIKTGCDSKNSVLIDHDIKDFWEAIMTEVYDDSEGLNADIWFFSYAELTDKISEESGSTISSFLAARFGQENLVQITYETREDSYIKQLETPNGQRIDYIDLFKFAVKNTATLWKDFSDSLANDSGIPKILKKDWDLDSGESNNKSIYWE